MACGGFIGGIFCLRGCGLGRTHGRLAVGVARGLSVDTRASIVQATGPDADLSSSRIGLPGLGACEGSLLPTGPKSREQASSWTLSKHPQNWSPRPGGLMRACCFRQGKTKLGPQPGIEHTDAWESSFWTVQGRIHLGPSAIELTGTWESRVWAAGQDQAQKIFPAKHEMIFA